MGAIFILAVVFILCGVFALPFWWDDMKCYFNNRKLFLKRKSALLIEYPDLKPAIQSLRRG